MELVLRVFYSADIEPCRQSLRTTLFVAALGFRCSASALRKRMRSAGDTDEKGGFKKV